MESKITIIDEDGMRKMSLGDIESVIDKNLYCLIREMEDQNKMKLDYNDDFIEEESYKHFAKWFNSNYHDILPLSPKKKKRSYSMTHRILIAYKTKYKCNMCKKLLPPTFQIDHIIELRDGGTDEFDNCQALCPNCHAEKTQVNTLKRHAVFKREFGRKAREMQQNAFEQFRYIKKSKYF